MGMCTVECTLCLYLKPQITVKAKNRRFVNFQKTVAPTFLTFFFIFSFIGGRTFHFKKEKEEEKTKIKSNASACC